MLVPFYVLFEKVKSTHVRVAVGDGGVLQGRLLTVRVADLGVLQPGEVMVLLPRDHEGGQVCGVDGEEDHGKESPDT